ncbi:MAG: response regulator [Bacteroidales bacterium]|nr:response regulator [Bacteroidales bacterium]
MKKVKILIAEDINTISIDIHNVIEEMGYDVQRIVTSGEEALKVIKGSAPDLALVDTRLNGKITGIETALMINEKYDVPVVFLSGSADDTTIEAVASVNAYGFVLKPFNKQSLKASIEVALAKYANEVNISTSVKKPDYRFMFIRTDYKLVKIDLTKIYYIEALKDYVNIHTFDNTYVTHSTMKAMMDALPDSQFVRTHRSYIMRLDKIHSIKYPDLIVEGKMKVLPIGGYYKKKLYAMLNIL